MQKHEIGGPIVKKVVDSFSWPVPLASRREHFFPLVRSSARCTGQGVSTAGRRYAAVKNNNDRFRVGGFVVIDSLTAHAFCFIIDRSGKVVAADDHKELTDVREPRGTFLPTK